jgi:recombination protein RecA
MPPKVEAKPEPKSETKAVDAKSSEPVRSVLPAHQRELDAAISSITKQYGDGAIMRLGEIAALHKIEVISTGSLGLDLAL